MWDFALCRYSFPYIGIWTWKMSYSWIQISNSQNVTLILLSLKLIDRTMSVMYPELFEHFENCAQGNLVLSQRMKKVVCFKMFAVKNTHVAFSDQGIEIRVKLMRKYDYIWEVRGKVEVDIKLALSSQKDGYIRCWKFCLPLSINKNAN